VILFNVYWFFCLTVWTFDCKPLEHVTLHMLALVLPKQSVQFLALCLGQSPWRALSGFDLSLPNPPPEGCLRQIQILPSVRCSDHRPEPA